jgi:hypothetical protein
MSDYEDELDAVIQILNSGWKAIARELPKPFETILLLESGRNVVALFMTDNKTFYEPALIDFETERLELHPIEASRVQFWMPLPKAPNFEKGDKS